MPVKHKKTAEIKELSILPVRDTVLFPNAILPLTVGRESSLKLINDLGEKEDKFIGVVAQRDPLHLRGRPAANRRRGSHPAGALSARPREAAQRRCARREAA